MTKLLNQLFLFKTERVSSNIFENGDCLCITDFERLIAYLSVNYDKLDFYTFEYDSLEKRLELKVYFK